MRVLDFIPKVGSNIIYEIKDSKDNIQRHCKGCK